jgi:hypothetical protein
MKLISYETNETIRTATIAEAIESLEAGRLDNGRGIIEVDGIACWVDATEADVAAEMQAATFDDAETFGREVGA